MPFTHTHTYTYADIHIHRERTQRRGNTDDSFGTRAMKMMKKENTFPALTHFSVTLSLSLSLSLSRSLQTHKDTNSVTRCQIDFFIIWLLTTINISPKEYKS